MPDRLGRIARIAPVVAIFVVAVAMASYRIRPWIAAPLAFDVAASVLHFERIVGGHRLEQALSTTPKPLLTLVDGLLHAATHDWRAISFASVAALGAFIALASVLASRLGGRIAALFVAAGLSLSPDLLLETARGLGSIWALLLCAIAGLLLTADRPRWGLAGAALAAGALARLEILLVVGIGLAVMAVLRFGPRSIRQAVPRDAWRLSLGLAALPVMLLHDAALTGDPLFWTSVAPHYSAVASGLNRLPSLGDVAREIAGLVVRYGAVAILSVVGIGTLAARRAWPIVIGLLTLGPGVAAFLLVLAARHVFVDTRYLIPVQAAMIFAAAIGLSAIRVPELAARVGWGRSMPALASDRPRRTLTTIVAGLLVVGVTVVWSPAVGPLDKWTGGKIVAARDLARALDRALPTLRATFAGSSGSASPATQVVVPVELRPRVATDLGLPLGRVDSYADPRLWATSGPSAGQVILISGNPRIHDGPDLAFRITDPATVLGVPLVPLFSDASAGVWVLEVDGPRSAVPFRRGMLGA